MKQKILLFILFGILTGAIVGLLVSDKPVIKPISEDDTTAVVERGSVSDNSPAPVFTLPDVVGNSVYLADYRGRVVIINFWATWCIPCKEELPILNDVSQEFQEELVVLAVNVGDNQEEVRRFIDAIQPDYPILIDERGVVGNAYHIVGYPTTYFVDAEGIIRGKYIGLLTRRLIQQYLTPLGIDI